LEVLYEPMKIIENIIISLTYAARTNKEKLADLELALGLVKTSSEEEEEDSQIAKERTTMKHNRPLLDMSSKRWCISTNESY
jgi:hypothetical protein